MFDINLGKFSGTVFSNISSIPFFLPLCVYYTFCSFPTVLGSSVLCCFSSAFVFFPFQFLRILLIYRLVQRFLPQQHPINWAHPIYWAHHCYGGAFFLSVAFLFGSFLGLPTSLLTLPICSCMLLYH